MQFNKTHHWFVCLYCDATIGKEEHAAYCNKSGICVECGQEYTGSNRMHEYLSEWKYDNESHWFECLLCHEKDSFATHGYYCTNYYLNPSKCYCGYEGEFPIKHAKGHWDETPATCLVDGSRVFTCTACKTTKTETIKAPGKHNETVQDKTPATCLTDGSITYKCSACGESRTEVIKAAGKHSEEIASQTPATCLVDGSIIYKCSACGESRTEVIKAAGKHSEEIASQTPATCLFDGSITYKCSACGESRTEVIKAVGKHEEVIDRGRKATCTEIGYEEGKHCSVCGEVLVDRLSIPATGHCFNRYLAQDGSVHTAICENGCGEQRTRDCEYEEIAAGQLVFSTCRVCGHVKLASAAESGDNPQSQLIETAAISPANNALPTVYLQILPADSPYAGARLFHISLCVDGRTVSPNGTVRVEIPLDNADTMQASDWQLFFISENGQMTEIPFEIADGKIVFTTTQLGMFLLASAGTI